MVPQLLVPLVALSAVLQSNVDSVLQHRKLPNGLEVIVVQNSSVPLATALVAIHNGAFTQDTDEAGLAHLYEHLLFHTFRGNSSAFAIETNKWNGAYNGSTADEVVNYFIEVPSENIEPAIGLLADLMTSARFTNGALKAERAVVLDELRRNVSDPEGELERQVQRALWGAAWHRKDVGGDSSSLERITVDRLKATYARYYVPNNAALIVTGDVDPARIFSVAEQQFRDWNPGPDPFADRPVPPIPPLAQTTAVLVAKDVLDVTIAVAFEGPSVGTDPNAESAADVLFDIFNDATSAFQHRLVEVGPFEEISGQCLALTHTGRIEFRGKAKPEKAKQAVLALLGELQNFAMLEGVTDEDLAIARKRRQVAGALARERTASLAPGLAFWWSTGVDRYVSYHSRLAAQTADSLRRFAKTYVVGPTRVIGVLGPPETVNQLGDWLRQGAPVTAKP